MTDEEFEQLRPSAFAIAYRMLGSVSEAEDIVQEGFLRLHREREGGVRVVSPRAFLATVVSRLSLDQLRSARARRETYVGDWLPEPLLTDADHDPSKRAEMADSLSMAFLILLESLSPEQRAVFLLREVFEEPYDRIAKVVGTSEQNARQLAARARRHLTERRPRFATSREQVDQLAARFFAAAQEGDLKGLEALLAHNVVFRSDGGGKVRTLDGPIHGRVRVARTLVQGSRSGAHLGFAWQRVGVNGQPGGLFVDSKGRLLAVMTLEIAAGRVHSVSSVFNPDKLRHLGPLADLPAPPHERN
jgi:RNA polymerase sigma-70 factor (ECF subfamily)